MAVDNLAGSVIKFAASWPLQVPVKGFEWVPGGRALSANHLARGLFLVRRPGALNHVEAPEDLYTQFAELTSRENTILDFANRYGSLRASGTHFHRSADKAAAEGEDLIDWEIEIRRFRTAFDLWWECSATKPNRTEIRRALEPKPGKPFVLDLWQCGDENNLIERAKKAVVGTINTRLSPSHTRDHDCHFPGCGFHDNVGMWADDTRAWLRASRGNSGFDLITVSSNLRKALWLQFAGVVAGQRKVKRCEAPDCGRYMDVTESESPRPGARSRPGARRMHSRCELRWKQKRYREGRKGSQ